MKIDLNQLAIHISRLESETTEMAAMFSNPKPLKAGVPIPSIPYPDMYKKIIDIHDLVKELKKAHAEVRSQ